MTDNPFSFNTEQLKKIEELRKHFPQNSQRSMILPMLWMVQQQHGHIPATAIPCIAKTIPVPEIWVQEVVSWYSMFNSKKVGKYHVQVCHNLSCCLRGAEDVLGYLKSKLGVECGHTSHDGKFTLSTAECLASCGTAPMMQINDKYYENLTFKKIDEILNELS